MRAKVLAVIGFVILVAGIYMSSYEGGPPQREPRGVSAQSTNTWTIDFEKGEVLNGHSIVTGGNTELRFYVKNPYDVVVLDAGTVKERHQLSFTAEETGTYTLYFDNTLDSNDSKTIIINYQISARSPLHVMTIPMMLIGGPIMSVGLISCYSKKKKEAHAA